MVHQTSLAYQHLHSLLKQLEEAEQALAHGPRRIAITEKKVVAAQDACDAQKVKIQQLRKQADTASLNLKSKEADSQKQASRLNEAGSNKEYEIIQGQINSIKTACETLEDEILTMLSDVDDATGQLKVLQEEHDTLTQKVGRISAEVKAAEPGIKADIERLTAEIKEAEKVMSGGNTLSTYRRVQGIQGAGAFAKIDDGYCEECNTEATPQDKIKLNMGEFLLCRACGRILYVGSDE